MRDTKGGLSDDGSLLLFKIEDLKMSNNLGKDLQDSLSGTINNYLNYVDGNKINLLANHIKVSVSDKYDYGATLDEILYFCHVSLENCIVVLNFINNDYQ
jgi:hypothetical protein